MGFIANAINKVFGSSSSGAVEAPTPAASPAPEADSATKQETETNTAKKKQRRGKSSLIVNSPTNQGGGSTGLNI